MASQSDAAQAGGVKVEKEMKNDLSQLFLLDSNKGNDESLLLFSDFLLRKSPY